jgi:hypothetical protein
MRIVAYVASSLEHEEVAWPMPDEIEIERQRHQFPPLKLGRHRSTALSPHLPETTLNPLRGACSDAIDDLLVCCVGRHPVD